MGWHAAGAHVTRLSPRSILCLGDSYTVGEGVGAADSWPFQLVRALRAHVAVDDPVVIARTGWTTAELLAAIPPDPAPRPHDLVTLMVGVNDQYRGHAVAVYRIGLGRALAEAVRLAGGMPARVLTISIPDWGVTPFAAGRDRAAIAAAIDRFNAAGREAAASAGVRWIDVTDLSRAAAGEEGLIAADGLHPAPEMYGRWVRRLLPAALEVLE